MYLRHGIHNMYKSNLHVTYILPERSITQRKQAHYVVLYMNVQWTMYCCLDCGGRTSAVSRLAGYCALRLERSVAISDTKWHVLNGTLAGHLDYTAPHVGSEKGTPYAGHESEQ